MFKRCDPTCKGLENKIETFTWFTSCLNIKLPYVDIVHGSS